MMEYLPKDLWVQIFLRLPVKTLLQCLSVCKSWQLFIQAPSFIDSHLQQQRRDLMLVRSITLDNKKNAYEEKLEHYSLYCDDESFNIYAKHEFPIHHPTGGHYRVLGSCNGIICITDDEFCIHHQTYLWNPTIQKCIELPRPMFTSDKIGAFDHELGFGFDEKTNDYKVVRIVERVDWDKVPLEVEIYSLSSGIWRKASHLALDLGVRIFQRNCSERNYQVYINGAVHWVGEDREHPHCKVIALHLGDEVFHCFEPPLDIERYFRSIRKLKPIAFQGSLSLIQYSLQKCSIWMMKDYGDSTSWAKHLYIDLSYYVNRVIGLRKKGELLIEIEGCLYSYKPTEGKEFIYLDEMDLWYWKLLQVGDHKEGVYYSPHVRDYEPEFAPKELGIRSKTNDFFQYSFHSESYVESLVLLGRMNTAEVTERKRIRKDT